MKKAVYAGSFDPVTKGHMWMIEEGAKLFDELVVSIGTNPQKKPTFSLDERTDLLKKSIRGLPNVSVDVFAHHEYLVKYAESIDATHLLRGMRSESDYDYEKTIRHINGDIQPHITSIFMMPDRDIAEVSSSLVKGLVGPKDWEKVVAKYLPRPVLNKFLQKHDGFLNEWNILSEKLGQKEELKVSYEWLKELYFGSNRKYHNLAHLAQCLWEFNEVKDQLDNPNAVELALWFHDAVYQTMPKQDNEKKSAELAFETLEVLDFDNNFAQKVYDMIMATKHINVSEDHDTQFMLDIDLAILGSSPKEFDEY